MSIQQVAPIPPLAHHDDRVDIYLRITADGNRYSMDIMAEGQSLRVPIDMSSHQLAELSNRLQKEMRTIARTVNRAKKSLRNDEAHHQKLDQEADVSSAGDGKGTFSNLLTKLFGGFRGTNGGTQIKPAYVPLAHSDTSSTLSSQASFVPNDEAGELFRPLAEIGHLAFNRVFGQGGAADLINYFIQRNESVRFQIASADFFLPWECLYPRDLDEPLDVESFWGMKHLVSRVITRNNRTGFVPNEIAVAKTPTIGLLTYLKLNGVREREVPFFDKLDEDKRIQLFKLRALEPEKKRSELREFRAFWGKSLHLVHLACHASYNQHSSDLSFMRLSNEFSISLQDMENYVKEIKGNPLLVLNACEMGNMNPLYSSYFAGLFLKYGARGVVATECAVPDSFAADFTEQLYTRLLAGMPLGESLLQVRQHFWQQDGNPSGLLYAMYAPPSIRLVYD